MTIPALTPPGNGPAASGLSRRMFLRLAVSGAALLAAPVLHGAEALAMKAARGAPAQNPTGQPAGACASGAPGSSTAASADRAGMFVLFSDVHFDPFADPGLVKALAAAPAGAWREILAGSKPGSSTYGQDANNALFQSFLDDMARRAPRPDFLLFPGDMLCHRFWTKYPRLTGDATAAGLLAFIAKTAEYFLTEVTRRFPDTPLYPALGNNDSVEGDFRIAPKSPYLSATAPIIARLALQNDAARSAFMATYPDHGCYALPLPRTDGARLVVFNNIFWAKRYPNPALGRPVLDYLDRELSAADRRGQKTWLMAHVPPGDNAKSSAAKYLKKGRDVYAPLLVDAFNDALTRLLVSHARTIKASFAGHVHRDEFRLFHNQGRDLPVGTMRLGPSISPITGNNPGYQVYAYDRESLELLDVTVHYLDIGAVGTEWDIEYVYSKAYGRGLRSPEDWRDMYQGLMTCPDWRRAFAEAFDLRSRRIREVTERTFPIYWRALGLTSRAAFDAGAAM